jgi:hypothetical protein
MSFDDYQEIRTLSARYNLAADTGDLDGYAHCFTESGIFTIVGVATARGCDELKKMMGALVFPTHHITTDAIVEVNGDEATQCCSLLLFGKPVGANDMGLLTTSRYSDQLVRTTEGWRFLSRVLRNDVDLAPVLMKLHPPLLDALGGLSG